METKNWKNFYIAEGILIILLIALDQLSKIVAEQNLPGNPIQIIEGVFELRYTQNTGGAFSILNQSTLLLAGVSLVVICIILYMKYKLPKEKEYKLLQVVTDVLLAGAIGNLIDRVRLGYVIDMFHFYWFEFPIFNVADICIVVSIVFLGILMFTKYKDLEL